MLHSSALLIFLADNKAIVTLSSQNSGSDYINANFIDVSLIHFHIWMFYMRSCDMTTGLSQAQGLHHYSRATPRHCG